MPVFEVVVSRHQTYPPLLVEAEDVDEAADQAEIYWRHMDDAASTDDWQLETAEEIVNEEDDE